MASSSRDNFKSMYKAKHKEESSTSSRRKSRGLERQKLRDDEVNKRRLLSVSDMSPVFEDKEETKDEAIDSGTQVKASNRLERLKQWREERKKKQEEANKNSKKPMFKVTHLEYKEELQLFNKERSGAKNEQKISGQPVKLSSHPTKPIAKAAVTQRIVSNVKANKVETKKNTTKEVNVERKNRLLTKATKLENKKVAAHNERTRSTVKAIRPSERKTRSGTKETNLLEKVSATVSLDKNDLDKEIETKNPRKVKNQTAQYCKPTTAAAAKSTNEKHTNFLRSKSHQVGTNKSKGNTKALKEKETEDVKVPALDNTPLRKKSVRLNVGAVAASSASESEQDLHLSDSNVSLPKHSTPRPARGSNRYSSGSRRKYNKTPGIKTNKAHLGSQKKSVRDLSPINKNLKKKKDKSANLESDDSTNDSTNEDSGVSSENKEVNISNISDKENMQIASSRLVCRSSKRSHIKDSKDLSGENSGVETSQNFTPKKKLSLENSSTPTHGSSTRKTRSQLNLGFKPSPAKRSRSAMASPENDQDAQSGKHPEKSAKRARFTNLKSPSSDEENLNIICHEVQEPDPDLPKDVVQNVFVTRKSLRVASLISDDMANIPEKKSLTPKKRKSMCAGTRKSRSRPRRNSQSVVVSVSDEGTSGALGDSIGQIQSAPENHYKVEVVPHNTHGGSNVKCIKSEFIDVSDEGTALISERNPSVVYQVIKSEGSSRALQELTVAKIDGEISFIEVPLEESVNVLPRLSQSSEENHSTQPFSPTKSNDVSQSSPSVHLLPIAAYSQVDADQNSDSISASQETPVTFRTLRRRAHSIAPTFKTPSATKSKKERQRRKTDHVLKSPEEMVKILSQSPLVEMSRRRRKSKFVLSSDENTENEPASVTSEVDNTTSIQQQDIVQFNDLKVNEEKMERVNYYKNLVKSETQRLNELGDKWTSYLHHSTDVGEDAQGQIRSTVGKSQLLIDQRFKQFTGLINDCEFTLGEKETTPTDLQGFWEMIYCQVEDVDKLFSNLTELEQNNWQIKQPTPKNVPKKKVVSRAAKPKVKSNFAAFRQEMMKRKAKETVIDTSIDLATVDSEKNKVFDAGFFKVSSPIRSYSGLGSKKTPVIADTNENSTQQTDISEVESQTPRREMKSSVTTPMSLNNKENKVLATPVNRLLSAKKKSYVPAVPSPLLNDITGLRAKK
ncbi:disks large-associated protein 5 [Biomphalaria pfeifferi]|uniref:Disks large-associated protein 5 n=1 Tax=Biomphalaria pfeifferi TaxID=112525 RepID=A0AAD8CBR7_BIOPF|nr:disks large-associated protein 5 [Biomphalaria pfeifferi]